MSKTSRAVKKQTLYMKRRDGNTSFDVIGRWVGNLRHSGSNQRFGNDAEYYRQLGAQTLAAPTVPTYGTPEYEAWYSANYPEQYAQWQRDNAARVTKNEYPGIWV